MAIKNFDWAQYNKQVKSITDNGGLWVGLLDEDGYPLMDIPHPISYSAPATRNAITNCSATIPAQGKSGAPIPAVSELIAENLGAIDDEGLLIPAHNKTRFIVFEREDSRRVYLITHCVARGTNSSRPTTLDINGASLLSIVDGIPAWSAPTTIDGSKFFEIQRDWLGPENTEVVFDEPINIMDMKMVTVADGVTLEGEADVTIKRLIDRSLQVVWNIKGITEDFPIVTGSLSGKESPKTLIRPTDRGLLETVTDHAASAGIQLDARIVFPSDEGSTYNEPTIVIDIIQE